MNTYDAVVIGGGPAGATAALMLARAGWSVAVIEQSVFPRRKVCGEFISASGMHLLRNLGVADRLLAIAGPAIRRVGLYAGDALIDADMPCARDTQHQYGRALGREHLDALLLTHAAQAGAEIRQPCRVVGVQVVPGGFQCTLVEGNSRQGTKLNTRCVIAAHGSWQRGPLPTQAARRRPRVSDLFAFKAHFRNSNLAPDLMPLLAFPGGYGGMVHTDDARVSLSCCIRRDALAACRGGTGPPSAAAAVFAHILASCRGAEQALSSATRDAAWLSAGPIRPGIRVAREDGIFCVGNAAGEAHPVIADGISMAVQSACLLCERLVASQNRLSLPRDTREIARGYESDWRKTFVPRIGTAALFAHLAMRPLPARLILPMLRGVPAMLTLGARLAGKARHSAQTGG